MPRRKAANGQGMIRQRKDGTWEGRATLGRDPGTGKLLQKSVYGKTQAEVRQKMTAITSQIDESSYLEPSKMTVSQWLDRWLADYTGALKPYTLRNYTSQINNHIRPYLGATKVSALNTDMIQRTYNQLLKKGLSAKTVRNVHGILHVIMETLVEIGERKDNPCSPLKKRLPKVEKKEMLTIADEDLSAFMDSIKDDPMENLFLVDLFTGMRQGEILGLRWSCIDFKKECILVDKQLYMPDKGGEYSLQPLKNRKARVIYPAPFVFEILRHEKKKQAEARLMAGPAWNVGQFPDLVFTNELGGHLSHKTVYKRFKKAVAASGLPEVRFHDMRHSYALASLHNGDDPKTVQTNLGHSSAAFTLDLYGHSTETMRKESAQRMETYIQSLK
jgi:integrase